MKANTAKILNALKRGSIRAIGGMVYDFNNEYLLLTSELYDVVKDANKLGIKIRRMDAGGSPTWEVIR